MVRQRAAALLTEKLSSAGYEVEPAPRGFPADLLVRRRGESQMVRVLAAAAPHHRGGTGSLGLHWMLGETPADVVALVDLSRSRIWLLPIGDFRARAQAISGDRHHLDWIVVPLGRTGSRVQREEDFDPYDLGTRP